MTLYNHIKSSLSFKLLAPIVVASIAIFVLVVFIINEISEQVIKKALQEESGNIAETYAMLSELDDDPYQIIRITNAISANESVIHLRLVDNESMEILADAQNANIGKPIHDVLSLDEIALLQQHMEDNGRAKHEIDKPKRLIHTIPVNLISAEHNRLRPFTLVLVLDKTPHLRQASQLVQYSLFGLSTGIFVLLSITFIAHRFYLKQPLESIRKTLEAQRHSSIPIPLKVHSNDEIGVISQAYNKTLEKQHNQKNELLQIHKYIDGITEEAPVQLAYLDAKLNIKFANKTFKQFYSLFIDKDADSNIENALPSAIFNEIQSRTHTLEQNIPVSFEVELNEPDKHYLLVTLAPDINQNDSLDGYFVCIEDQSAIRSAEEKLMEYTTELEFKTWDLEEAKEHAEASTRAKSEFLAAMSHEIRTPINGVLGMLSLLLKEGLNDKQYHYARLALSSGESLLTVINDILDFSKIEAGKLTIESVPFNIYDLMSRLIDSFQFRANEKSLTFNVDISPTTPMIIIGDPTRITQIITNYVNNALKFTQRGSISVSINLRKNDKQELRLYGSVKDTGIGIPEEKQDRLFQSFSQIDASTTREYGGTGLGLAIVKKLTELMLGDAGCESTLGEGSKFWFEIHVNLPLSNTSLSSATDNILLAAKTGSDCAEEIAKTIQHWPQSLVEFNSPDELATLTERAKGNPIALFLDSGIEQNDSSNIESILEEFRASNTTVIEVSDEDVGSPPKEWADTVLPHGFNGVALFRQLERIRDKRLKEEGMLAKKQYSSNITVLLVEDNDINQEVASGMLNDLGVQVDIAQNGLEALTYLAKHPKRYDMVFMDCQMPFLDGYESTRIIRRGTFANTDNKIPIIAMTANAMKGDQEACLIAGMSDYIAKPVDFDFLKEKLRKWTPKRSFSQNNSSADKDTNNAYSKGARAGYIPAREAKPDTNDNDIENKNLSAPWDKATFMKRVRNKPERALKLINLFCDDMPERMQRMENAIREEDSEKIFSTAHEIKGVCANLAAQPLAELAAKLEAAGKANTLDKITTTHDELCLNFDKLIDILNRERDTLTSQI